MVEQAWLASVAEDLRFVRRRLLVGVTALAPEDLDWQPVPTLMSARQQLVHVARAERHWRACCTGEGGEVEDPGGGVPELLDLLADQRRRTMAWFAGLTAVDLVRNIDDGRGHRLTVAWVLNHLVRHDAHHAGQIILLWRLRHPDEAIGSRYDKVLEALATDGA